MEDESQPPPTREGKQVVLILVGAAGSGKTTFCNDVLKTALRPWLRVCQDTIANGKAGTKFKCLKCARDALNDGKSVLIDRCNLDREQRADFVKLGGPNVDVQAVVLDLPSRLCISRSVKRTGHEGNLQGGKAAAVVNRMLQNKELPKLSEGFSRITFCQNESDVKGAVSVYSSLGPSDNLPSGCYGKKNVEAKVQLGIMRFLKKVEVPDSRVPGADQGQPICQEDKNKDCPSLGPEKSSALVRSANNNAADSRAMMEQTSEKGANMNTYHTLAFPSISTSDFQFNHDKASDIIAEKVDEFLRKINDVRLILVDLTHSHMLSLVQEKAAQKNIDSSRFLTIVGDITRLHTGAGLHCSVIANAANWRLRPGGGGVNAAIFSAAGHGLEVATKERAETLSPGNSVVIPLPPTSPLCEREGVTHVIHVLGPNMNPQRPNCLKSDYIKGCKILRDAYSSLFDSFASVEFNQKESSWKCNPADALEIPLRNNHNDRSPGGDQKVKRGDCSESERNKKYKGLSNESGQSVVSNFEELKDEKVKKGAKKVWQSWAQALYHIALHPEKHKDGILEISDDIVVLHDVYPKAKKHLLVLSRVNGLEQLSDVRKEHVPLLKSMHSVGLKWIESSLSDDAALVFRLGYHSVPSMRQLHLHVISQDFSSPHLKNKKHWNSFNTAFFRDSVDVIEETEKFGKATLNDDKLLSIELRCHRCRSAHPNIPRLKTHIASCRACFPALLLEKVRLVCAPLRELGGP